MYTKTEIEKALNFIEKAKRDLSKLTKKVTTDKTGKKVTKWVKREGAEPEDFPEKTEEVTMDGYMRKVKVVPRKPGETAAKWDKVVKRTFEAVRKEWDKVPVGSVGEETPASKAYEEALLKRYGLAVRDELERLPYPKTYEELLSAVKKVRQDNVAKKELTRQPSATPPNETVKPKVSSKKVEPKELAVQLDSEDPDKFFPEYSAFESAAKKVTQQAAANFKAHLPKVGAKDPKQITAFIKEFTDPDVNRYGEMLSLSRNLKELKAKYLDFVNNA